MRSLDTLPLTRPKPEVGRAPAGEDARADVPSGFEAMLGALESGTGETGAAERGPSVAGEVGAEPAEAGADLPPALPADASPAITVDVGGSALQALMALTGPAAPAIAAPPDASLEAMVQRAALRAGSGPGPAPAEPALQMSMVGLETHFAPVRPRGAATPAEPGIGQGLSETSAPPTVPTSGRVGAMPVAPVDQEKAPVADAARTATAADAIMPPAGGPDGHPATASEAMPLPAAHSDVRDPAAPSDRPAPEAAANGLTAPAAAPRAPSPGNAAKPAAPAGMADPAATASASPASPDPTAATPARPTGPDPEPDHPATPVVPSLAPASDEAVRQPAAAPVQATVIEALRSPTARGAPRSDRAAPAGAADNAARVDRPDSPSLTEPAAIAQPSAPGQTRRDPDSRQDHPAVIARPETTPEHATVAVPRPQVDGGFARPLSAETDAAMPEAPRPEIPLAQPVAQETAGTPAPVPASPLRQIVDAVAAQLPAAPTSQARTVPASTEAGPLKILTLQLHPADLGSVLVRMRLQDGRLEMSLRTSREETAERLRKESELLSGLLREAGYEPEAVTIQAGGPGAGESAPRGQGFAAFAGSQGGQHDRQPGAATPDQSGRRPSPRADAAAESTDMPTGEQDHETDSRGRDRGSLYL
ncbi:flagellar hook-length control protein FliK [Methylobacterium sp. J-043]|nr:flagellar hook-length control protein FliK [Methylobacterium sp. J-043]